MLHLQQPDFCLRADWTHTSCRGWLISILSLFTAGSAGPLDTSASLSKLLISSEKDASKGTERTGLLAQ